MLDVKFKADWQLIKQIKQRYNSPEQPERQ